MGRVLILFEGSKLALPQVLEWEKGGLNMG